MRRGLQYPKTGIGQKAIIDPTRARARARKQRRVLRTIMLEMLVGYFPEMLNQKIYFMTKKGPFFEISKNLMKHPETPKKQS